MQSVQILVWHIHFGRNVIEQRAGRRHLRASPEMPLGQFHHFLSKMRKWRRSEILRFPCLLQGPEPNKNTLWANFTPTHPPDSEGGGPANFSTLNFWSISVYWDDSPRRGPNAWEASKPHTKATACMYISQPRTLLAPTSGHWCGIKLRPTPWCTSIWKIMRLLHFRLVPPALCILLTILLHLTLQQRSPESPQAATPRSKVAERFKTSAPRICSFYVVFCCPKRTRTVLIQIKSSKAQFWLKVHQSTQLEELSWSVKFQLLGVRRSLNEILPAAAKIFLDTYF